MRSCSLLASLLLFGCTEARITGIYKETESTDTAVTAPNTAPDCALLEPEDRSAGPEGATVFLTGTATDAETPNDQLTVDFESDQDGAFGSTAPTTAGDVLFPWSDLSVGDHVLTMTVTDAEGALCSTLATYTVTPVETTTPTTPTTPGNAAPTAPIVRIEPADAKTLDELVAVIDTPSTDPDGDAVTYSYLWTVDGVDPSAGDVDRVDAVYTERGQAWTVTVTPTDGALEGPTGADTVTIGNTAPSVDAAIITPVPASVGDTLTCSWVGFDDADGDPDASTVTWTVDGVAAGSGATLTPDADDGAVVTCVVTPFDGEDEGLPVEASVTLTGCWSPSFNGVSSAITIPQDDAFDTEVFTASLWLKLDGSQHGHVLVKGNNDTREWSITHSDSPSGEIFFNHQNVSTQITWPEMVYGEWAHVAVTSDGGEVVLYLNGEPVGSVAFTPTPVPSDLTFGNIGLCDHCAILGEMAEVAFFDEALAAEDVAALATSTSPDAYASVVAYWPLHEGEGLTGYDTTGTHHGTLMDTIWVADCP